MVYANVFSKDLNFVQYKIRWQIIVCGAQKQITNTVWDVSRGKGEVKKRLPEKLSVLTFKREGEITVMKKIKKGIS